jgi:hypothetical protein
MATTTSTTTIAAGNKPIGVRSPYFVTDSGASVAYGTLNIDIGGVLDVYVITKDVVPGTTTVTIDISQLVRDYIQPAYFSGFNPSNVGVVTVTYELNLFESDGTPVGTPLIETVDAYDAYYYYYEGNNYILPSNGDLVTGGRIYVPEGESGFIYKMTSDNLSLLLFTDVNTVISSTAITRLPCSRYDTYTVVFINRFGVHQQMFFTAKTIENITTNGSKYKSKFNNTNGSINTNKHQVVDYNKNARRQYTLNTDYISINEEAFNAHIQELLLSEFVWIDDEELNIISVPVNVATSSVQYKTSLNDRLVSYTIVFEQAFDLISTGR